MLPVNISSRLTYIDSTGAIQLTTDFDIGVVFVGEYAIVGKNDKYGVIDRNGTIIIPVEHANIKLCGEGYFKIQRAGLWGLIDKSNSLKIPCAYASLGNCVSGRIGAQRRLGYQTSYLDLQGNVIIEDSGAPNVVDYSEGLVKSCGEDFIYGYRDLDGNWAIRPEYTSAGEFSEGLAAVDMYIKKKTKTGFIDKHGVVVLPFEFDMFRAKFSNGLAIATGKKNLYGAIDKTGHFKIPPQFNYLDDFSDGMAYFKDKNNKFGYIDTEGNVCIEAQYESSYPFVHGLAKVKDNEGFAYIDKKGFVIWRLGDIKQYANPYTIKIER